jgi:hypothetical protein
MSPGRSPATRTRRRHPSSCPTWPAYEHKAHDLAHALHELVTIERFVTLADWKAIRHAPLERRVLMGTPLLVR